MTTNIWMASDEISNFLDYYEDKINKEKDLSQKIPYNDWKKLQKRDSFYTSEFTLVWADTLDYPHTENENTLQVSKFTFEQIIKYMRTRNKKKENTNMNMNINMMNFDFGVANNYEVSLSPYGIAISDGHGRWITYDATNNKTVDVTDFNFNFEGMIYKIPCAIKDARVGDLIRHQGCPMYIVDKTDSTIEVIDVLHSEKKTIIPMTNVFGFDFVTKFVSFIDMSSMAPSADQPFGNIMPLMIANSIFKDNNNDNDFSKMMMLSMLMGASNPFTSMFNLNPKSGE